MKIGLLGGTFDPVHNGHLEVALTTLRKLDLDEVWFLVNNIPPHKQKNSNTTNKQRLDMLNLVVNKYNELQVCDIELKRDGKSYTYETILELNKTYPEHQFYFIIGADNVEILPKWYQIDELIKLVTFVAVKRSTYKLDTDYDILEVEMPYIDVSSTDIRNGSNLNIDKDVLQYIKKEGLYARK